MVTLDALMPKLSGRYGICTCPVCGHREAYFYTSDVQKKTVTVRCNRLSKCGAVTQVSVGEEKVEEICPPDQSFRDILHMSEKGADMVQKLVAYQVECTNSIADLGEWRGISPRVLKESKITMSPGGIGSFFRLHGTEHYDKRFMGELYDRDILIPIYNDKGVPERLLLRSSKPLSEKYQKRKEINMPLAVGAEQIWNLEDMFKENDLLFVTEGAPDALSIKEADSNLGVIALPGVGNVKMLIRRMDRIRNFSKKIIVCFDNDPAGDKYAQTLEELCQKRQLQTVRFNLHGYNDLNEYLVNDRQGFIEEVSRCSEA